jgi:hypothetical protein
MKLLSISLPGNDRITHSQRFGCLTALKPCIKYDKNL